MTGTVSKKNVALLCAVATAVADLDGDVLDDVIEVVKCGEGPGLKRFRRQLKALRNAREALFEQALTPATVEVTGELRSEETGIDCWDYVLDGKPLCFILDESVVPELQGNDASYGKVTFNITFHEREDRNA